MGVLNTPFGSLYWILTSDTVQIWRGAGGKQVAPLQVRSEVQG